MSKSLKGLKWITFKYPQNPYDELMNLKEIVKILSQDTSKKKIDNRLSSFSTQNQKFMTTPPINGTTLQLVFP